MTSIADESILDQLDNVADFKKYKRAITVDPTEDEIAREFVSYNRDLRYVADWNRWMRWNGHVWERVPHTTVYTLTRKHLRTVQASTESKQAKNQRWTTVHAIEKLAECDERTAAKTDQWDVDDRSINTPAGIVDLSDGELVEHDPQAFHTKTTAVGPDGSCPLWKEFLREITDGNRELVRYLRTMAGYCLTGLTREHALFFCYGTGANGKGTFLNTLAGVFHDYATIASMDSLTEAAGDRHPTDLASLQGARLVVAQETDEGRRLAEARIKSMTGGDPITARFMRQDPFTFIPKFKIVVAGNHKPQLRNVDEAIRRRLHLIPFTVTIPEEKRDTDLQDKLRREWPGILHWAIDGAMDYFSEGLRKPACVSDATNEYFTMQDAFREWIEECCEMGDTLWDTPMRLFASWRTFAENTGERPGRQAAFKERLISAGFNYGRKASARQFIGIRVREQHQETGQFEY